MKGAEPRRRRPRGRGGYRRVFALLGLVEGGGGTPNQLDERVQAITGTGP